MSLQALTSADGQVLLRLDAPRTGLSSRLELRGGCLRFIASRAGRTAGRS